MRRLRSSSAEKTHSSFIFIWTRKPLTLPNICPCKKRVGDTDALPSSSGIWPIGSLDGRLRSRGQWTLMGNSLIRLPGLLTLIVTAGLGLSAASAQTSSQSATSGSGQYYVEFRSRQAWDTLLLYSVASGRHPARKTLLGFRPRAMTPKCG